MFETSLIDQSLGILNRPKSFGFDLTYKYISKKLFTFFSKTRLTRKNITMIPNTVGETFFNYLPSKLITPNFLRNFIFNKKYGNRNRIPQLLHVNKFSIYVCQEILDLCKSGTTVRKSRMNTITYTQSITEDFVLKNIDAMTASNWASLFKHQKFSVSFFRKNVHLYSKFKYEIYDYLKHYSEEKIQYTGYGYKVRQNLKRYKCFLHIEFFPDLLGR